MKRTSQMKNKNMKDILERWREWKVREIRLDLGSSILTTNNFTLLIIGLVSLLILLIIF